MVINTRQQFCPYVIPLGGCDEEDFPVVSFYHAVFLCGCAAPAAETTPEPTPAETPRPEPTPEPTPTPVPFSYENVFSEIFSDEALSALYPDIEDYDKERARVSANIARIEDFEFYELTEEEQEFIKEAQLGNIDSSQERKLREVLTKILNNDPYVFDDVDNEVKLENRVISIASDMERMNEDTVRPGFYEEPATFRPGTTEGDILYNDLRSALKGNNCGYLEKIDYKTVFIFADSNISFNYVYKSVLPNIENDVWREDYFVFDCSKFLLDGSDGHILAKKLYKANGKFLTSKKENFEENLREFVDYALRVLLINDVLGEPDGISSLNSKMHKAVLYDYCLYYVIKLVNRYINPNYTYIVPKEFAEIVGTKTKLKYDDLRDDNLREVLKKCNLDEVDVYMDAFEEIEFAQKNMGKNLS